MPARFGRCVIPIHRQLGKAKRESFGSGVLLRILDSRFLVSAAQVFNSDCLWLPGKPKFVPLDAAGQVMGTSLDLAASQTDIEDVGYVALHALASAALTAQARVSGPRHRSNLLNPSRIRFP